MEEPTPITQGTSSVATKASKRTEKQANRNQALEKEFSRAQKGARLDNPQEGLAREFPLGPPASPLGVWSTGDTTQSPEHRGLGAIPPAPQPSATRAQLGAPEETWTPTATGLRPAEPVFLPTEERLASLIAQAVDRALEARARAPTPAVIAHPPIHQPVTKAYYDPASPASESHSVGSSFQTREPEQGIPMSEEEEEPPPEAPQFKGLFNPSFFVALLCKATATAHLGADISSPTTPDPHGFGGGPKLHRTGDHPAPYPLSAHVLNRNA